MKDYLNKVIEMKQAQAEELRAQIKASEDVNEVRSLGDTLEKVLNELKEAQEKLAEIDEPAQADETNDARAMKPLATMTTNTEERGTRKMDNMERREAFKNYIATGKLPEKRGDGSDRNETGDAGSVIPENLLNQIMEKIESVGTIYNLVTKTAYPVGQTIPREATKPVATWVGRNTTTLASSTSGEGEGSVAQKGVNLTTSISFTNFKLRCEVAMTEEVANMTLSAFESLFIKNVSLAMLRAIEFAIVDGDGYGMPTGILNETAPDGQAIEIGADEELTFAKLCEIEGCIPAEKEGGAKWCMTKKTFMALIGMMDDVGQPVARVNYGLGGKPERTLLGREVILYAPQVGSHLGNYAGTVEDDTLVAFIFDFSDYTLNNNYNLGISHKLDWDNEDHRTKAVACYDGKVIDKTSLVTVTKAAE